MQSNTFITKRYFENESAPTCQGLYSMLGWDDLIRMLITATKITVNVHNVGYERIHKPMRECLATNVKINKVNKTQMINNSS